MAGDGPCGEFAGVVVIFERYKRTALTRYSHDLAKELFDSTDGLAVSLGGAVGGIARLLESISGGC